MAHEEHGFHIVSASEVEEISRLDEQVKAAQIRLLGELFILLKPGRKVLFKCGQHIQQGEVIGVSEFYWVPDVWVRNIKTNKERRISLYSILSAYRN